MTSAALVRRGRCNGARRDPNGYLRPERGGHMSSSRVHKPREKSRPRPSDAHTSGEQNESMNGSETHQLAPARDGEGELLAPHLIPGWVDARVGRVDSVEGYADLAAKDESRAWVALMEGPVHAALVRLLVLDAEDSTG